MKNFRAADKSHAGGDEKHDINFHWPITSNRLILLHPITRPLQITSIDSQSYFDFCIYNTIKSCTVIVTLDINCQIVMR